MGRLISKLKITGKLDNLSLYNTKDGIIARLGWGPDKKRQKKDKAFAPIKKHGEEWKYVGQTSSFLMSRLRFFLESVKDNRLVGRLNKMFFSLVKLDDKPRGERRVFRGIKKEGADKIINGFEFNESSLLKKKMGKWPKGVVEDRLLHFEWVLAKNGIKFPKEATHAEIQACLASFDLEKRMSSVEMSEPVLIKRERNKQTIKLSTEIKVSDLGNDLILMRILFYKVNRAGRTLLEDVNCGAVISML